MKITKNFLRNLICESLENYKLSEQNATNNVENILLSMFGKKAGESVEAGDPIIATAFQDNIKALEAAMRQAAMRQDENSIKIITSFSPYIHHSFSEPAQRYSDQMEKLIQPYAPKKNLALKPIPSNVVTKYIKLFKDAVSAESKISNEPAKPYDFKDMANKAASSYYAADSADSDSALDAMSKLEENKTSLRIKIK